MLITKTRRTIRALSLDDLDLVTSIWTNPAVREYLGGPVSVVNAAERLPKLLTGLGMTEKNRLERFGAEQIVYSCRLC